MYDQHSLSGSSVRSYKQIESPRPNPNNLVKHLHTQTHLHHQQPQTPPLIIRNKSYEALTSRVFQRLSQDKNPVHSQRFYESIINSSSQQKYINQVTNLQNQITKLMASELSLRTEKELLAKEIRRLKEEIQYLNEKCDRLEDKAEELFKNQARTAIIEREYHRLLSELEQHKNNCRILHGNQVEHMTNLPTKVEPSYSQEDEDKFNTEYYRLKARESSSKAGSNRFNGRINQKVSWKKASGSSPIYKLDQYRKYSGNRLEEVSLIQSKIDKIRDEQMVQERVDYQGNNDHTKTIDLKDLEKLKEYDLNMRALSSQIREIRSKNIVLYKKSEEFEQQRTKLLENINELNYDKSRLLSEQKAQENEHRKEVEKLRLELEEHRITIIEVRETLASKEEALKLAYLEKTEIEQKIKKAELKQESQQGKTIAEMRTSLQKSEKELAMLRQRWQSLTKRQEQIQIENKLHIHELQEKKSLIAQLQTKLERLRQAKQKPISLEQESILSKTQNIMQKQYKNQVKSRATQTEEDMSKLIEELKVLRQVHQRLLQEHNVWGFQLNKLQSHNAFINDNYLKLTQLYEQQKIENSRLKELSVQWYTIQAKTRTMKKIDQTIDHLWQIKEVEYENVHHILHKINQA